MSALLILSGLAASIGSVFGIVILARRMNPANQLLYAVLMVVLLFVAFAGVATAGCGAITSGGHL